MCVFSSCAGLCVRALFVKKGICAYPNLPLNRAIQLISSLRTACWSTQKRDFGFFFHLVVETDLSEKKVVFSFVSGNTQLTFVGENTHQKLCLRRERRKDERERLGREAFVGEKKKKRFALS